MVLRVAIPVSRSVQARAPRVRRLCEHDGMPKQMRSRETRAAVSMNLLVVHCQYGTLPPSVPGRRAGVEGTSAPGRCRSRTITHNYNDGGRLLANSHRMEASVRQRAPCPRRLSTSRSRVLPTNHHSLSRAPTRINVDNLVVAANTAPMATLPEIAKLLAEAIRARGVTLPQRFSIELGAGESIDILVEDSSCRAVQESFESPETDAGEAIASRRRESGTVPVRSGMLARLAKSCRPEPLSEPSSRTRQHETLSSMPPEEELA